MLRAKARRAWKKVRKVHGTAWYTKAGILAAIVAIVMVGSVLLVPPSTAASGSSAQAASGSTTQAAQEVASAASTPGSSGPHPGTLQVYEVAPGGATTEDPSVAYDTVSYEPILNVYQTLIAYNGSSTTSYVPEVATCIPGSSQCIQDYGSTLVANNNVTGNPEYYTFVIDSGANFYDPSTGASWGVYPSDVAFSLARTMSFANGPAYGVYNGWILTQAMLPAGNSAWDGGIHAPFNNTPGQILSTMLVNDSAYCPSVAMTQGHGCITLNMGQGGTQVWPFFLQLVADPLGASIEPCGWYTAQSAGVPGFPGTTSANGDGPCLLPGNDTSTSQAGFQAYLSQVNANPTAWDTFQGLAFLGNYAPQPNVQWNLVGSGPYYSAATIDPGVGYVLKANPAYNAPAGCAGQTGCEPEPGQYQGNVNVYWEATDAQGIAEYRAGQADLAGIQLPADISSFNLLVSQGLIDYTNINTISIFFQPINLDFNVTVSNAISGSAGQVNVPGNFFSSDALRQFLIEAVPYDTVNSTLLQLSGGISIGFGYGGAIPKGMNDAVSGQSYYGYNISWPNSDPGNTPTVNGTAAWWWAQMNNPASPYYDAQVAACSSGSPCTFPLIGEQGDTFHDAEITYMIGEIEQLSGGALQPYTFDLTFSSLIRDCAAAGPGTNGCPLWNLGWAPDYPDPSDYVTPMYLPDSTYTYANSVAEALSLPAYNLASCPFAATYTNPTNAWSALVYYHSLSALSDGCQGVAYNVSTYWYNVGLHTPLGAYRALIYQMSNQIDYLLGLYVWNFQSVTPASYAPWILGSSLNSNVAIGGGGDNTWYTVAYTSSVATATFTETGLSSGTSWSVNIGGGTYSSTTSSVSVQLSILTTTSYPYTLNFESGYTISPAAGTVDLSSGDVSVPIVFNAYSNGVGLSIATTGLVSGTSWTALLLTLTNSSGLHEAPAAPSGPGLGAVTTSNQAVTLSVPMGSYSYSLSTAAGYTGTGTSGSVVVTSSGGSVIVPYRPSSGAFTYGIVVNETGLLGGSWSATVGGATQTTTASSMTFFELNGTYAFSAGAVGYSATPASGTISVVGGAANQSAIVANQTITLSFTGFTASFSASGLAPIGSGPWTVTVNGQAQTTTGASSSIVFPYVNATRTAIYTFVVTPPTGYTVAPAYGLFNFSSSGAVSYTLLFTPTTGSLSISGLISGSSLTINGALVSSGTNSTYLATNLPVGLASIEIQASGYNTYFNNVTVNGGQVGSLVVTPTSSGGSSSSSTTLSTLAYIIIAVLVILVIIFIATTMMARRGKPPAQPPESWKSSETPTSSEPPK